LRYQPLREAALVVHEQRERKIRYLDSILSLGDLLESPGEVLGDLSDLYLPSENKELSQQQKAEYIRSFEGTDWSEIFIAPERHQEDAEERKRRQEDNLLKHYTE